MRILRIISFLAMCGVAIIGVESSHIAHAMGCDVSVSLASLENIKNDPALSDQVRLVKELDIRRQALKKVIGCATNSASSLNDELVNATTSDSIAVHLQSQLANQMNDSLNYYNIKKNMIGDLGLQGTKDFAKDVEMWREGSEIPLETKISAFLLWNENRPIINAAENRLTQINHAIISLDLSNNQNISEHLLSAKNKLAHVEGLDRQIGIIIGGNDAQGAISGITDSLDTLKDIYQEFFSLSTLVQKTFSK